jgi:uncharacterized membrane protein YbhN (UPF0104 family)
VNRKTLQLASRLALTFGLLAVLVFVVVDPGELLSAIRRMRLGPLLLAIGLAAVDRVLMAYKWRILLAAQGINIPLLTTIRAYFATTFVGLFLPITIGADLIRVLAVREYGLRDVTISIVLERTIGVMAMGSLALVSCWLLGASVSHAPIAPITAIVVAIVVIAGAGLAFSFWIVNRWGRGVPESRLGRIARAYDSYRGKPGVLVWFFALSLIESLIPPVLNYVVALGLGLTLPFWFLLATVPLALTLARLPISLGGFGVQEASFVYFAGLLGVPKTDALATVLVAGGVLIVTLLPSAFDTRMLDLRRRAMPHPPPA